MHCFSKWLFLNIDDNTEEHYFDDNGVHHIITYTQDTSNNWNHEEFLNIDLPLNLSQSQMSVYICKRIILENRIKHFNLIYREINRFTLTMPQTDIGICSQAVFTKFSTNLSPEEFQICIDFLIENNHIYKNALGHFRTHKETEFYLNIEIVI